MTELVWKQCTFVELMKEQYTPLKCDISLRWANIAHNFDRLTGFSISCCVTAAPGRTGHVSSGKSRPNVNQVKSNTSFNVLFTDMRHVELIYLQKINFSHYLNVIYSQTHF